MLELVDRINFDLLILIVEIRKNVGAMMSSSADRAVVSEASIRWKANERTMSNRLSLMVKSELLENLIAKLKEKKERSRSKN